jgi:hypothetical protein
LAAGAKRHAKTGMPRPLFGSTLSLRLSYRRTARFAFVCMAVQRAPRCALVCHLIFWPARPSKTYGALLGRPLSMAAGLLSEQSSSNMRKKTDAFARERLCDDQSATRALPESDRCP